MSRLRRELKPYISTLRLSRARLIVHIEGADFDPVFYGKILRRFERDTGQTVEIRRASELPSNAEPGMGGSGGQRPLTQAAELWEKYRAKHLHRWRNQKAIAFCIDKDVADVIGLPEYVPSIIRTPLHSVENHLLLSIDFIETLEAALSLAPGELGAFTAHANVWMKTAFSLWQDWVVFCILCLRLEVNLFANYSTSSIFNSPLHAQTNHLISEPHFLRLQVASGLDLASFGKMRTETDDFIREMFEADQHDRLFKGKWYIDILFSQLTASQWGSEVSRIGKRGLFAAMRSQFKVREEDYKYYYDMFTYLARLIGTMAPI